MLYCSVVQMVQEKNCLMFLSVSLAHFTWLFQAGWGWMEAGETVCVQIP